MEFCIRKVLCEKNNSYPISDDMKRPGHDRKRSLAEFHVDSISFAIGQEVEIAIGSRKCEPFMKLVVSRYPHPAKTTTALCRHSSPNNTGVTIRDKTCKIDLVGY